MVPNTALEPFCYEKVGVKGVYISWTCFPDGMCAASEILDADDL